MRAYRAGRGQAMPSFSQRYPDSGDAGLGLPPTHRFAGRQEHLVGPENAVGVGGGDPPCHFRVDARQGAVQPRGSPADHDAAQTRPPPVGSPGPLEQPLGECPEIEPGAACHHRDSVARPDVGQRRAAQGLVFPGRKSLAGRAEIEQMMAYEAPLGRGRLSRSDVHPDVHLEGVAVDDLARKAQRQFQGERRLAGAGRPEDGQRRIRVGGHRLSQPQIVSDAGQA